MVHFYIPLIAHHFEMFFLQEQYIRIPYSTFNANTSNIGRQITY